jgi:ABC-type uncharacterized transport system permease subunit
MQITTLILGILIGFWLTYSIVGAINDMRSAKHVFGYGLAGIASSLLTKLLLLGH